MRFTRRDGSITKRLNHKRGGSLGCCRCCYSLLFLCYRPDPSDLISVLDDIPPIQYFITQVQRALQTPEQAVHWCSLIVHGADLVYNSPPTEYWKLFRDAPSNGDASTKAIHTLMASFLQNVTFLTERHESVRNMLLRYVLEQCETSYKSFT